MNLLFKPMFVGRIQARQKTVTRRRKKPAYKVGDIVCAKTDYKSATFLRLRIKDIFYELKPGHLAELQLSDRGDFRERKLAEAVKEGCDSWRHFGDIYTLINGARAMEQPCYRIEFEVVG